MKNLLLVIIIASLFSSCHNKKENELEEREKALDLREKELKEHEADYKSLLLLRDSILAVNADSIAKSEKQKEWPTSIKGLWNSKMLCKESNCNNYVIGDQRNEVWQFTSDSTGMYTQVLNNKKLVRVFNANYEKDKIILQFVGDSTSKNRIKIDVVLDDIKQNIIRGTQTITGQNNCSARFSVELTVQQKK